MLIHKVQCEMIIAPTPCFEDNQQNDIKCIVSIQAWCWHLIIGSMVVVIRVNGPSTIRCLSSFISPRLCRPFGCGFRFRSPAPTSPGLLLVLHVSISTAAQVIGYFINILFWVKADDAAIWPPDHFLRLGRWRKAGQIILEWNKFTVINF